MLARTPHAGCLPLLPTRKTPGIGWNSRSQAELEVRWGGSGRSGPAVSGSSSRASTYIYRPFTSFRSRRQIYEREGRKKEFRFKLLSLKWVSLYIKKLSRPCGRNGLCSGGINLCVWKKDLLVNLAVFFVELAVANHYTSIYLILKEYKTMGHK